MIALYQVPDPPRKVPDTPEAKKRRIIVYLVRRRFPIPDHLRIHDFRNRTKTIEKFRGQKDYLASRPSAEKSEEARYRSELEAMSIGALSTRQADEMREEALEKQRIVEAQHPSNFPSAFVGDFAPYLDFPHWTVGMSVALLLQRDPAAVTWEAINSVPASSLTKRFRLLNELMVASISAGELKTKPQAFLVDYLIEPSELIRWASTKPSISVPHALLKAFSGTLPPTELPASAQNAGPARRKPGRPKGSFKWPWDEIGSMAMKSFEYHGDFRIDDPDWDTRAKLVDEVLQKCEDRYGRQPPKSEVSKRASSWRQAYLAV